MDTSRFPVRTADNIALGQGGFTVITDTTAYTGGTTHRWVAVQCLTETVFAVLTNDAGADGSAITTATFPAGSVVFGLFSAITLTSGTAIAYKTSEWVVS
jgi:hypothetical protein